MGKKNIILIVILVLMLTITASFTYSRYYTSYNTKIGIIVREPEYIINFNSNGGTGSMESQTISYNQRVALSSNEFKKYGYQFVGWNTLQNGNGTIYNDEDEVYNLSMIDGDEIDLYAQWQKVINIRIEDVSVAATSNGSASNISFDYETATLSNLQSTVNLNNSSAYVTYDIDITNYINKQMGIYSITGLPSNLEYEIVSNYNLKEKLCDASQDNSGEDATVQLRIKYKSGGYVSGNTTYNLDLDIQFKKNYNITYENIYSANNYPSDVILNNYYNNSGGAFDINSVVYPSSIMEGESLSINFYPHIPNYLDITNNVTSSYTKPNLTLSNPTGDITITNLTKGDIVMYDHPTSVNFNGSNNINTGIQLLSSANYKRNFRVEFTIDSRNNSQDNLATLFNAMNESGSPWPGVMFRIDNGQYHVEANGGSNQTNRDFSYDSVSSVTIEKIDGIVTISINGGQAQQIGNYNNYNNTFNIPATFGSSMQNSTSAFRYFKGALSKMKITYLDDEDRPDTPGEDESNERWILVENTSDIIAGETYLIAYYDDNADIEYNSNYMGIDEYSNIIRGEINLVEAESDDNYTYYKTNDATNYFRWTFDTDTTGGKIKNVSNNQYIYFNNGTLTLSSSNKTTTTISKNNSNWLIHSSINSQDYYIKYNVNNSHNFSIGTGTNNHQMKIYKLVDAPDDRCQVVYGPLSGSFNNSNNLNTNIKLFNNANYGMDFEISLTIDSIGSGNGNDKNTILNSMYEGTINNVGYPGFAFRIENSNYVITCNQDAVFVEIPISRYNPSNAPVTFTFIRENKSLYYQINNEERVFLHDFTNDTARFDTPITFGSSLNTSGNQIRNFSGNVSNIIVKECESK